MKVNVLTKGLEQRKICLDFNPSLSFSEIILYFRLSGVASFVLWKQISTGNNLCDLGACILYSILKLMDGNFSSKGIPLVIN